MSYLLSYNITVHLRKQSRGSRWRAGRQVAALWLRRRFGRSVTVEVCNPKSGLVVHTRKPQLEGSYTGVTWINILSIYGQRSEPSDLSRVNWDTKTLKSHSPFPQVFEHLLIMGLHTYTGSRLVSVSNPDRNWTRPCFGKIVDPSISKIRMRSQSISALLLLLIPIRQDKHQPHRAQNPPVCSVSDRRLHPL